MTPELARGPFINEEGDIWVAVDEFPVYADAEAHALTAAYNERVEFVATEEVVSMSDHELGDGNCPGVGDCDLPQPCTRRGPAWHFREVEP